MSGHDDKDHAEHISNLQESFSKQQKKISVLKELVRKSEAAHGKSTSTAQEKVKNIAQRLTHLKSKARSRLSTAPSPEKESTAAEVRVPLSPPQMPLLQPVDPLSSSSISHVLSPLKPQHRSDSNKSLSSMTTPGSEKVLLLRQQMEQNKALMAQRASSKQHLEQLVSQLKEKFDTTQQCLEDTNELGKSMNDLSALMVRSPPSKERHKSATDLTAQPFSLEKEKIKFLENRCRLLEKQLEKERQSTGDVTSKNVREMENKILELEKQLEKEKQSHSRQEQTTSEKDIRELENKIMELEKRLEERQSEIGERFAEIEQLQAKVTAKDEEIFQLRMRSPPETDSSNGVNELEIEIGRLRDENAAKQKRLAELEEVNMVLESTRGDLTAKNKELHEQIQQLTKQLQETQDKLEQTAEELNNVEGRGQVQSQSNEPFTLPDVKADIATDSQVNLEMAKQIQESKSEIERLKEENEQLRAEMQESKNVEITDSSIAEKIASLEATIESQRQDLQDRLESTRKFEEELMEKTIELNVLNANFKVLEEKLESTKKSKPLFLTSDEQEGDNSELRQEIKQLKQKLDESNKAMIKLKLKCKQTEKQVEKLKKSSDLHAENIKLEAKVEELQQKILELEDEKGQWQLTQIDETKSGCSDPEELCKTHTETIRLLEEQKFDQLKKLESTEEQLSEMKEKLERLQSEKSARVISELSEINLEEQLEEQAENLKQLQERLTKSDAELEEYKQKLEGVYEQKKTLEKKLEHYIVENMELVDKLEKLSKSSSSAESIEIVERLTQQERAEIDEFNKRIDETMVSSVNEITQTEMEPELSESIAQLREESSELMNKIELFTNERREVLEKMENLNIENHELINRIEELTEQKKEIEKRAQEAETDKQKYQEKLEELAKEKDILASEIADFKIQKAQLSQELTSLQKSSEVVAALDSTEGASLFEKCEKSLSNLNSELESYRRAGDKNAKFNASKKLAKEAKNAHTQLSELLQKVKEASHAVETVTVVETVVAVTAPNGKALAEYEQLTAQNRELKVTIEELRRDLQEAREGTNESGGIKIVEQVPAITDDQSKTEGLREKIEEYEKECSEWQSKVEDLRTELETTKQSDREKTQEILNLAGKLEKLRHEVEEYELKKADQAQSKVTEEALERLEEENSELQETISEIRTELRETRQADVEKTSEISQLNDELNSLRKLSDDLDRLMTEKNSSYQKEVADLTLLRRELEGKCDRYESEMGILQTLVAEQKQQLIEAYQEHEHELNLKLLDLQQRDEQIVDLRTEIKELKTSLENAGDQLVGDLQKECDKLREALKINKNLVTEQLNELSNKQETIETLNQQIIDLYKTMEDNSNKLIEKEDELVYLQELLASNSKEMERLRKDNDQQKSVVDKLLVEIHSHKDLQNEVSRLESEKRELDNLNKELEKRNKEQLEKMKKFAANLKKRSAQCQELETKIQELEKGALEAAQTKHVEEPDELKAKERLEELEKEFTASKVAQKKKIEALEKELTASESAQQELNDTIERLYMERDNNSARCQTLQHLIDELQNVVSEKTEIIESLESQNEANNSQLNNDLLVLQEKFKELEERLKETTEELKAKSLKFEKSKAVIKERNNQIHRLQAQLKDLQDKMRAQPEEECVKAEFMAIQSSAPVAAHSLDTQNELDQLKQAYDKLSEKYSSEKTNFEATIAKLETLHDGIQAKLQENMSYIEALENENAQYKEKICKLEECVAVFEERRASMDRRTNVLCAQMQSREIEYEETEDELIRRLNMLSEKDGVLGEQLLQSQQENVALQERFERLQTEFHDINVRYGRLEHDYHSYRENIESTLETESTALREQLAVVTAELERTCSVYDAKLAAKSTEIDELECDLNEQVERTNNEKRSLKEELERSRDECTEQKDEIVRLKESLNAMEQVKAELERETTWLRIQNESSQQDQYELQELRMQAMHDKTEIDNLRHQIESLAANHEVEMQALRTQISELDTLRMQVGQNQTDDQVFIETENKRLTDLLAEKEAVIENYQRQCMQLQMSVAAAASGQSFAPGPQELATGGTPQNLSNENEHWQRELNERNEQIARLQRDLAGLQMEFNKLLERNNEMQRQMGYQHQYQNQSIESPINASSARPLSAMFSNEPLPAPPLFFSSEAMTPSPFDEIIQAQRVENLESAGHSQATSGNTGVAEQRTIEDLQRNVSDLEKHAQDLENKLAMRNRRELEFEERLSELQGRINEVESLLREREMQLSHTQVEMQNVLKENETLKESKAESHRHIEELMYKMNENENQLKNRESELSDLKQRLFTLETSSVASAREAVNLAELQKQIEHLQELLKQRDSELQELKASVAAEQNLKESTKALENLIIPDSLTNLPTGSTTNPVPTLDMFFGGSSTADFVIPPVSAEPVVEESIVPEKAYICYPDAAEIAKQNTDSTHLELGDGWGDTWDTSEAKAEAEHFSNVSMPRQTSLLSREQELDLALQEKSEKIQELQLAIERCEQQKQELQVKSGKMMKKLKEYKTKLDKLETSSTSGTTDFFGDLDAAIQDELKAQIERLEAKLEEEHKANVNQCIEKEKLLKRIDVLEAGSERMAEMKERQDMEVHMYQTRIKELQEKLKSLEEWGAAEEGHEKVPPKEVEKPTAGQNVSQDSQDSGTSVSHIAAETIDQLENKIRSLTAELQDVGNDRQELQALYEEEKANTQRAEEMVKSLQQQISALDNAENDEKMKYDSLRREFESLQQKLKEREVEQETLRKEVEQLKQQHERDLQELQQLEELRRALNETRVKLEEMEIQFGELQFEVISLKTRNDELSQANEELQQALKAPSNEAASSNQEVERLTSENTELSQQKEILETRFRELEIELTKMQSSVVPETLSTANLELGNNELFSQLQEKEAEIAHLKQRIEDLMREDQTEKLVLEILTKNQEIHLLKMQVKHLEDDKQEMEHNLSVQITKEMQANKTDAESVKWKETTQRLEAEKAALLEEKKNMIEELNVLNNHVLSSLENEEKFKAAALELDAKNIEISELRKTLETLKATTENTTDFVALNAQWEAIVEQRCGEIAKMWRDHLEQREKEFKANEEQLRKEIAALKQTSGTTLENKQQQGISAESTATSTPASESTSVSGTTSATPSKEGTPLRERIINEDDETAADVIIEKMQAALESQEIEIVSLKEQLAIRSAEYARLAAQYDPFKLQTATSHSSLTPTQTEKRGAQGDAALVPKSELDLALYMLHQRDMRCEEMTLELVSLLEERDTLQLKLSNTLRQVEAIKAQTKSVEPPSQGDGAESAEQMASAAAMNQSVASDASDELNHKLSQLQTVNHSKDKVIKEERDQRIRQMEKIQQDVAKMPSQAVSELVGSDFSQTGQSPSSVLLNWLWGNKSESGSMSN